MANRKASIGTKNQFFNTNSKFSVSGKLGYGMGIRAFLGFGIAHWTVGQMESAYVDGKAEISANSSFDIANSSEGLPRDYPRLFCSREKSFCFRGRAT